MKETKTMKHRLNIVLAIILLLILLRVSAEEDSDLDSIPDITDKYPFDKDNDGMPDVWEKSYNLSSSIDDAKDDADKDGITNIEEYRQGINPIVPNKKTEFSAPKKDIRKYIIFALLPFLSVILLSGLYKISKSRKNKTANACFGIPTMQRPNIPQYRPPQNYQQRIFLQKPIQRLKEAPYQKPMPTQLPEGHEEIKETGPTEKDEKDVFKRLSEHIDNHKRSKGLI